MSKRLHNKQKLITRAKGYPHNKEGKDGDFSIRDIPGKGVFLYYKHNGKWYSTRLSHHTQQYREREETIYLPKRVPKTLGEIGLHKGKIYVGSDKEHNKQIIKVDKDGLMDSHTVRAKRSVSSTQSINSNEDWIYENDSGDTRVTLKTHYTGASAIGDAYINYVYQLTGETTAWKGWCVGMDTLHGTSELVRAYSWTKIDGSEGGITPSTTANRIMSLRTDGVLEISGGLELASVSTDTAGGYYLIREGTTVKQRTAAAVRADIGAGTSSVAALNDLSDVTYSSGDLTITSLDKIISGDLSFESSGIVIVDKNSTATTTSTNTAMQIDFDQTGIAASGQTLYNTGLDIDLNCESVTHVGGVVQTGIDIDLVAATDGNQYNIGMDINVSGSDGNRGLNITTDGVHIKLVAAADVNDYATFALADTGDLTIATIGSGSTDSDLTLDIDGDIILDSATGITKFYLAGDTDDLCTLTVAANGQTTIATADSDGTSGNLILQPDGELVFNVKNGRVSFYDSDNLSDYARFDIGSDGGLQITTVDSAISGADFVVDADGDIILDSHNGKFEAKKAGTEFSSAGSAYAGMILGYTDIGLNETHANVALTTSFAVPTDEHSVTFTAPPCGNVEIWCQFGQMYLGSSGAGDLYAGLSTANATDGYSALASYHEEGINNGNIRYGFFTPSNSWTLTGLTAGTSYTYWVGVKSSSTSGTPRLYWGGNSSLRYPDFIMKAIALPVTIAT